MRRFLFLFSALPSTIPPDAVDNVVDTSYFLYILKSGTVDRYYVGISSNPARRLEFHNTFEKGFTSRYRPWRIVFTKAYPSKAEAHAAEKMVKGWKSRRMIERLIGGDVTI